MSYEIALFLSHYTGDGVVGDGPRLDEEVQMVDGADQNRRGGTWRGRFDARHRAERHFNLRERSAVDLLQKQWRWIPDTTVCCGWR
jgi:hypothetical protein